MILNMKSRVHTHFHRILPAYLNGRLDNVSRFICRAWLRLDSSAQEELDRLQQVQHGIQSQENQVAPLRVMRLVRNQIKAEKTSAAGVGTAGSYRWLAWFAALAIVIVAVALVWYAMPPAVMLEWSVQGDQPVEFRIYRARAEGLDESKAADYQLLKHLPGNQTEQAYSYSDILLVPGQQYLYRVEAVDASGVIVQSGTVPGKASSALPAQLISLAGTLILLYVLLSFFSGMRRPFGFGSGGHVMVI